MDIRRLEVFCKVFELKSFTKAAEALSLSQPTVSDHVRGLEQALGERLIDRFGREILPTPAGQAFYKYALSIVNMLEESMQTLGQFRGRLAGRLVLGASTIPGTYILPRFIGTFKSQHSAIKITIRISDSAEIVDEVLESSLESGLVGWKSNDRRLLLEELCSDELVLAVHPDHQWAGKRKIHLEDLVGEPFILRERGSGTRMVMSRIMEEHGLDVQRLEVVAEMGSTEAVRQGIKSRIGISILSKQAVGEDFLLGTLVPLEIEDVRFFRPLYLAQRKNRQLSPLCQAFLNHLRVGMKSMDSGENGMYFPR
ncbi:MAG: selenium metabolism-associated LysR family transcriptional regulator [Deltaproteobacteria bacterium]|nr:selenium metabolism-associated LysR family transcriptional regulator [Deltaproteobacteria bacterium]